MGEIDKPNVLEDEVFTYRVSKDDKVFIYWRDKQVKIWHGSESRKVLLGRRPRTRGHWMKKREKAMTEHHLSPVSLGV